MKKNKQTMKSRQGSTMRPARSTMARMKIGFGTSSQEATRRMTSVMYHSLAPRRHGNLAKTKHAWSAWTDSRTGIQTCWAMRYSRMMRKRKAVSYHPPGR